MKVNLITEGPPSEPQPMSGASKAFLRKVHTLRAARPLEDAEIADKETQLKDDDDLYQRTKGQKPSPIEHGLLGNRRGEFVRRINQIKANRRDSAWKLHRISQSIPRSRKAKRHPLQREMDVAYKGERLAKGLSGDQAFPQNWKGNQ